jgi:hypothetical protein
MEEMRSASRPLAVRFLRLLPDETAQIPSRRIPLDVDRRRRQLTSSMTMPFERIRKTL